MASMPLVTTQIVGPEKMAEGFGFMLFCQSYSNVMGPPFSGNGFISYRKNSSKRPALTLSSAYSTF